MHWYAREPRVVLKDTLAVGPGHRRGAQPDPDPVHLAEPGGRRPDLESQIADLATGLDENDAFVIFPEGGNFTPAPTAARRSTGCASSGWSGWRCAPSR